jgi:hypothetical protein
MAKGIVVLDKGVEKKEIAMAACCANAPTGKLAK